MSCWSCSWPSSSAVYLDAVSGFLQRRLGDPRTLALAAAVALTLGALVGVVFLIVPAVACQVQDLVANLPQFLTELDQSINRLFRSIPVLRRGVDRRHRARGFWPRRSTRWSGCFAGRWCPTSREGSS